MIANLLLAWYVKIMIWIIPLSPFVPLQGDSAQKRCEVANMMKAPVDIILGNFRGVVETYSWQIAIAGVGLIAVAAMWRGVRGIIKFVVITLLALLVYMALVKGNNFITNGC